MRRRPLLSLCIFIAAACPEAGEPASLDALAVPVAGEWMEYQVAFPLDPLESSIRRSIGKGGGGLAGAPAPAGDGPSESGPRGRAPGGPKDLGRHER